MRLRLCVDDLRSAMWTIFDENSTPMVCEERTRPVVFTLAAAPNSPSPPHGTPRGIVDVHSSLTNRCKTHDLHTRVSATLPSPHVPADLRTFQRRSVPAAQSWRGNHTCCPAPVGVSRAPASGPRAAYLLAWAPSCAMSTRSTELVCAPWSDDVAAGSQSGFGR
jgi:hypothetical protein